MILEYYFPIAKTIFIFVTASCRSQAVGTNIRNYNEAIRQVQNSGILHRTALYIVIFDIDNFLNLHLQFVYIYWNNYNRKRFGPDSIKEDKLSKLVIMWLEREFFKQECQNSKSIDKGLPMRIANDQCLLQAFPLKSLDIC